MSKLCSLLDGNVNKHPKLSEFCPLWNSVLLSIQEWVSVHGDVNKHPRLSVFCSLLNGALIGIQEWSSFAVY